MARIRGEYVVTGKDFPEWLKEEMKVGRARVVMSDGEFDHITIQTPSGSKNVRKGDKLLLVSSGMVVMPAGAVERYAKKGDVSHEGILA